MLDSDKKTPGVNNMGEIDNSKFEGPCRSTATHEEGVSAEPVNAKELGRRGEQAAVRFLERKGYEILETNWECFAGEADIISIDEETLVFTEVKTRTSIEKGFPAEAVDAKKRERYEKIAACYLRGYDGPSQRVRFDVISILVISEDRAFLRLHTNAFCAAGQ